MTHQHLIDNAIFDTTIAAGFDQQAEVEDFLKKELMKVVDEVFDKVDRASGDSNHVFRIPELELDLGEIPYREYRQQMPNKLREQLMLALGDMRYPAGGDSQAKSGLADRKNAEQEQLVYFLRNGHLPWYSRLEAVDGLESILIEALDSTPARLIEFMLENGQHASVIERLKQQFSQPVVERVLQMLPSTKTAPAAHTAHVDEMHAQLVAGLLSGDFELVRTAWQLLQDCDAEPLERILRHYGQQAIFRQHIVAVFSPAEFDELLRLLEPGAYEQLKMVLDQAEKFEGKGNRPGADQSQLRAELREYTLTYLLVERSGRFDEKTYIGSLLRQLAAFGRPSQLNELVGELSRRIRKLAAGREYPRNAGAENRAVRYERIKAALTLDHADRRLLEPDLLADIRALAQDSPGLLMRLYRELQSGDRTWERVIVSLPVSVLAALTDVFLALSSGSDVTEVAAETSELGATVRSNVAKSSNRQIFYAQILGRLIRGELIDFDEISAAELGGATAVTDTAIVAASDPTRALFNERYFSRQLIEKLIRQVKAKETEQFRDSRNRGLPRNSQPSNRDMAHRLIKLLAEEGAAIPVPDTSTARDASELDHDAAPLENIYIANAGAVLIAPYLPRLFERLGLTEEGQFKDRNAAERGVHCVQFLVNESTSSPEYQLVLNKLLCGVRPGRPIRRGIELAADEKKQLEGLLRAIIENWTALGNTSIAGLRESFLQRNGRLQLENDAWRLSVEARPFDMLLDQLPWSFSTIKFAWMDRVIYVEWR